jgi:hypothetical protein
MYWGYVGCRGESAAFAAGKDSLCLACAFFEGAAAELGWVTFLSWFLGIGPLVTVAAGAAATAGVSATAGLGGLTGVGGGIACNWVSVKL